MQLVIMRHGQTNYNLEHRYTGTLDIPLNDAGRTEAHAAGAVFSIDTVYTSHLSRARETAHICFPQATQIVRSELAEMNFGAFQGRSPDEMEHDDAYRMWVEHECQSRCPQGEARDDFVARVARGVCAAIAEQAELHRKRTIIVAHGGTIMATLVKMARSEEQQDYFSWLPKNCCGYYAEVVNTNTSDNTSESTSECVDIARNVSQDVRCPFELRKITRFNTLEFLT